MSRVPPPLPPLPAPPRGVPPFEPLLVRGRGRRLHRALVRRRRAVAAGLAVTAAALAASGPGGAAADSDSRASAAAAAVARTPGRAEAPPPRSRAGELVSAPVRIADAATVRLLRRGDRVDVIASGGPAAGTQARTEARVVAAGARVTGIPEMPEMPESYGGGQLAPDSGALLVLSVPRATATALAGAAADSELAVTLC